MNLCKRVIPVIASIMGMCCSVYADGSSVAEELSFILKHRSSVIKSVGFAYTLTLEPTDAMAGKFERSKTHMFVRHSGEKRYFFISANESYPSDREYAFDGKRSRLMHRHTLKSVGRDRHRMTTHDGMAVEVSGILTPNAFLTETIDLVLLKDAISENNGKVSMNDNGIVSLVWSIGVHGAIKYEYQFDSTKEFAVVGFNSWTEDKIAKRGTVQKHEMVNVNGFVIPLPTESTIESYYYWEDNVMPLGTLMSVERMLVNRYEINEDYPEEAFVPEIKEGTPTKIWDRNLKLGLMVGSDELSEEIISDVTLSNQDRVENDNLISDINMTTSPERQQKNIPPRTAGSMQTINNNDQGANKPGGLSISLMLLAIVFSVAGISLIFLKRRNG